MPAGGPFVGDTLLSTIAAIVNDPPPPIESAERPVPAPLRAVVGKCLEKDPTQRYADAGEIHDALVGVRAARSGAAGMTPAATRRARLAAIAALAAAIAAGAGGALWVSGRRAREQADVDNRVGEIERYIAQSRFLNALRAARTVSADPRAARAIDSLTYPLTLITVPAQAQLSLKEYAEPDAEWVREATTPLDNARVPSAFLRWRIESPGYEPVEGGDWGLVTRAVLHKPGEAPPGMVLVPESPPSVPGQPAAALPDFWIDRFEVTNREFKRFVDEGGYRTQRFWTHPILRDSRTLAWTDAVALFHDQTGQPGPSTWELGSYPDGQADYPVRGVSWYEAAAFAAHAGKSLPTVSHWRRAAGSRDAFVIAFSNFSNKGPVAAGATKDVGPYGTYQMAGNVKEWTWNAVDDVRYILGGAWNEASYMAVQVDARPPFDRSPTNGFRCVKYLAPPPENTLAPVPRPFAAADGKPASDAEFEVYRRLYGYDKSALNARVEAAEDAEHWRRERATIDATYGRERFAVQLYLPKSTKPPYQAVVWLGGGDVLELPSSDHPGSQFLFDFVVRTGRAVVLPVLQGTYERRPTANAPRGANTAREMAIQRSSDLGRTIDYLETRSDFDRQRVAYYGLSYGANLGQLLVPLEPRITTAVLLAAGLQGGRIAPERDPVSFVPRFRVPTLMIGGRDDFLYPVNTHQKPLFDLLAAPRDRKKHVVLDGVGHMIPPRADVIREVLAWFDAYLGPVERR